MFNRSEIMKAAWNKFSRFSITFSQALRLAWAEAKMSAARYNVWGQCVGSAPVPIGESVNSDRAGELEWWNKTRYDRIWMVKIA